MKTWNIPAATAQQFAANDYVSACSAVIDCNVALVDGFGYYHHDYGKTIECVGAGPRTHGYYSPCGEKHDVSIHGELVEHTFTQGYKPDENGKYNTNIRIDLAEPINCYVWYVYNEDGLLEDVHATMTREGFQSNKS